MPIRFLKDDNGNDSSMRLVFIVFMVVTVMLLTIITALTIRAYLSGMGDTKAFDDLIKWLTTGSLGAFLAKVAQKYLERKNPVQGSQQAQIPPAANPEASKPKRLSIIIDRYDEDDKRTLGNAGIWDGQKYLFKFVTLELPWKDNRRSVSRIPSGEYEAIATPRASNGRYAILLMNVVDRSEIMLHIGNYTRDIRGCILPGRMFAHIDKDDITDVVDSGKTLGKIAGYFPVGERLTVLIRDRFT